MAFRVLIIGATGQVGSAVVRALAAEPSCATHQHTADTYGVADLPSSLKA